MKAIKDCKWYVEILHSMYHDRYYWIMVTTDYTGEKGDYKDDDECTIKRRQGIAEFSTVDDAINNFQKYAKLNKIENYSIKE